MENPLDPTPPASAIEITSDIHRPTDYPSLIFEILSATNRDDILQHLLELGAFDRRLRFCSALPDSSIAEYVAGLDFERDLVLGYRERDKLVALVHMGALRAAGETELGISVAHARRGRGLGLRLTSEAFRLAGERGFTHVHVYYMDENLAMRAIVGHYPVPVHRDGGDNEVRIPLSLAA
jgi:ribosomal protein S18 acetylase RimI-like enzyme